MKKLFLTNLFILIFGSLLYAQNVEVTSKWHEVHNDVSTLIYFNGPEISDPQNMHDANSANINIPVTSVYSISVDFHVGLGGGNPNEPTHPYGTFKDRILSIVRISNTGEEYILQKLKVSANTTTQSYIHLEAWAELFNGDIIQLRFRYTTGEEYIWVLATNMAIRNTISYSIDISPDITRLDSTHRNNNRNRNLRKLRKRQ